MSTTDKFVQMVIAIVLFYAVMVHPAGHPTVAVPVRRAGPGRGLPRPSWPPIGIGLLYPAIVTMWQSLHGAALFDPPFVGLDNYKNLFTDPTQVKVLRNTLLWVILTALPRPASASSTRSSSTAPGSRSSPRH